MKRACTIEGCGRPITRRVELVLERSGARTSAHREICDSGICEAAAHESLRTKIVVVKLERGAS